MLVPVLCFTCGTMLGNKWEDYKERTEVVRSCIRLLKIRQVEPDVISQKVSSMLDEESSWLTDENIEQITENMTDSLSKIASKSNSSEIIDSVTQQITENGCVDDKGRTPERIALDSLGLTRYCCRMNMLGSTDISVA